MWNTSTTRTGPVVLLVEDDDDLREMTTQMLEMRGFTALVANDAVTAITTCRVYDGAIDVLLTDLGLPGVSGGELARSAAAIRPAMEIIYISGIPQDIAIKKGLIKAGSPFISKPFTTDVLAGTLRSVLARHSNAPAP
ncbi:response regulator [Actinoplanes sp. NPDC026619]|uniref:response regulator n=1 Tax=Actinoplanes sp. NPDC026619 TaxID=3155798 RepID=UPI0034093722